MRFLVIVFAALFVSQPAITETVIFNCVYNKLARLDDGEIEAEDIDDFVMNFIINTNDKSAHVIGNAGTEEVTFVNNNLGVSFIEVTLTGNIATTTISDGMQSVHSRNMIFSGLTKERLSPSQYYGKCSVN